MPETYNRNIKILGLRGLSSQAFSQSTHLLASSTPLSTTTLLRQPKFQMDIGYS